jgi:hypothetical protein
MAADPSRAMPMCPLASPGITITASDGPHGTDLLLGAANPGDETEVRRRAHRALDEQ